MPQREQIDGLLHAITTQSSISTDYTQPFYVGETRLTAALISGPASFAIGPHEGLNGHCHMILTEAGHDVEQYAGIHERAYAKAIEKRGIYVKLDDDLDMLGRVYACAIEHNGLEEREGTVFLDFFKCFPSTKAAKIVNQIMRIVKKSTKNK